MRSIYCLLAIVSAFLSFPAFSLGQGDRNLERAKAAGVAEKRVALVIGNAAYTKAKPLANPANDAADMAKALKDVGFEVFSGVDLDKRRMETLIREFGTRLANGGTGLFYYAGHGIQVGGENYLVPVDADIPEEDEVAYTAIPLGLVLSKMSKANNDLNIVILDACRNNPFARSWRGFRDAGNADGLAKISPPTGTLVLYATEPGKVASDGTGRNGLFTESLLKQIKKPNVEYDQMVRALSTDVWQKSNKQQLPWKEGNSLRAFYFIGDQAGTTASTEPLPSRPAASELRSADPLAELEAWNKVKASNSAAEFNKFLQEFPDGAFSKQAREKMNEIGDPEWNRVRSTYDPTLYRAYLANNPKSPFASAARERMNMLAESMIAWEQLGATKSVPQLESYVAKFPDGVYTNDAKKLLPFWWEKSVYLQPETAISDATRELAKDPNDINALRMRSSAFCRSGQVEPCNKDAETLLKLLQTPKTSGEFEARCYAERRLEKYDDAIASCTRALEMDPSDSRALYNRGQAKLYKNLLDDALVDLSKAIELNSFQLDAFSVRAEVYLEKQNYDLSIADNLTYLKSDKKTARIFEQLGEAYYYKKDYTSALTYLNQAIELEPNDASAKFFRGMIRQAANENDLAIADYTSVIEAAPKYWPAYTNRGVSYTDKKEYDKAVADFSKSIELNPDNPNPFNGRARVYDLKGMSDQAKADRKKAEELIKTAKQKSK